LAPPHLPYTTLFRSQPRIARVAHADQGAAPALTSDGCHAGLRPQPVVISGRQQPRGFGEHRGGDDSPDAPHGPEDRHVTMLLTRSEEHTSELQSPDH